MEAACTQGEQAGNQEVMNSRSRSIRASQMIPWERNHLKKSRKRVALQIEALLRSRLLYENAVKKTYVSCRRRLLGHKTVGSLK